MFKYVGGKRVKMSEAEEKAFEAARVPVFSSADVKAEAKARADTTQPADARLEMLAEFAAATMAHGADPTLWPADVRSKVQAGVADWEKVKAIRAKAEQIAAMKTIPTDLKDERLWQADGKAV